MSPIPLGNQGEINPAVLNQQDEEKRKREAAAKAADNAKKGMDPNGNKLKRKNTPQGQAPLKTRDPLKGVKDAINSNPVTKTIKDTAKEVITSTAASALSPLGGVVPWEELGSKTKAGSEAIQAVKKAIAIPLEGVVDKATLAVDTAGTLLGNTDQTRNPWNPEKYEAPLSELQKGPQTFVAKTAASLIGWGLSTYALSRVGAARGSGSIPGLGGKLVRSTVPGAVANVFLTKADDQNFSTMVRDLDFVTPEMEDHWILGLAINRDDNPFVKVLKTTVEGGVMDVGMDVLGPMLRGRKASQAALKAGKGKDEALEEGLKTFQMELDLGSVTPNKLPDGPNVKTEQLDLWPQAQEAQVTEAVNGKARAAQRLEELKADPTADPKQLEDAKKALDDAEEDLRDLEDDLNSDPNLKEPHEKAAYNKTGDINSVAAQQIAGESNIPKVARSADIDPTFARGAKAPVRSGSDGIHTDASYKIIASGENATEATIEQLRKLTPLNDLQAISKMVGKTMNQTLEQAAKTVDDFRGNVLRNDQVSIREFLREQKALKTVTEADGSKFEMLSANGIIATKSLITDTTNQIYALARNHDALTDAMAAGGNQFDRIVDRIVTLNELHKITGYVSGFDLQSFKYNVDAVKSLGPDGAATATKNSQKSLKEWAVNIKKMARRGDPDAKQEMERLVRALVLADGDPLTTVNFAQVARRIGTEEAMGAFYNSQLSGPLTHFANMMGTGYSTLQKPMSTMLHGALHMNKHEVAAGMAGLQAITDSVGDAWKTAKTSFASETSIQTNAKFALLEHSSMAEMEKLRMTADGSGSAGMKLQVGFLDALHKFYNNPLFNWSGRALVASDDAFKTILARVKINMDATYDAHMLGGTNVDAAKKAYLKRYMEKIAPTGEIMDKELLDYVTRGTFQQDPGHIATALTNLLDKVPLARLLVPYIRTPSNLLEYSATHFPLFNKFTREYSEVMKSGDALRIAEYEGRQAVGAFAIAGTMALAHSGLITGSGPVDREQRAIWLRAHGGQPKCIKVGGKWVSYARLEPLSSVLQLSADIYDLGKMMKDGKTLDQLTTQAVFAIAAVTLDKSYLQGVAVLAALADPKNLVNPDAGVRGLLAVGNNFIPLAGTRRSMANALNPYMREIDNEVQKLMLAAAPAYALTRPLKIDPFTGKPFHTMSGGVWNSVMPFQMYDAVEDPVIDTLVESEFEWNDVLRRKVDGTELEADEQNAYNTAMAQLGLKYRLSLLFQTEDFKNALAEWNADGRTGKKTDARHYVLITEAINDIKRMAAGRVEANHPELVNRSILKSQEKNARRSGDITEANRLQKLLELAQ